MAGHSAPAFSPLRDSSTCGLALAARLQPQSLFSAVSGKIARGRVSIKAPLDHDADSADRRTSPVVEWPGTRSTSITVPPAASTTSPPTTSSRV